MTLKMIAYAALLAAMLATGAGAQDRPPGRFGADPGAVRYALAAPANGVADLELSFPGGERKGEVLITLRFERSPAEHFVRGACRASRAGYDCRLRDSWRTPMRLRRTPDGLLLTLAKAAQVQEAPGAPGRNRYDSDFYYRDLRGRFTLVRLGR
jgi:hypothetical protein